MNAIQSVKHKRSHKPLMNAFHDRKPRPKKKKRSCLIYSPFEISTTMKESAIHDTWMLSLHMWVIIVSEIESFFSWKKREGDDEERRIACLFSSVLGSFHFDIAFTAQHMEMWCALIAQDTRSWESIFNCWIKKQLHVSLSKKKEVPYIWIWRFMK